MKKPFKNEDRSRYYGLRIGDKVTSRWVRNGEEVCEVVELGYGDNNRCYLEVPGIDKKVKVTAESCKIVTKVEHRSMKEKITQSEWNHFHDVILDAGKKSLTQKELESLYDELEESIKEDIEHWGLSDTVVRDDIYEWYQNNKM